MDGVWLPADGEPPVARGFPGSRHKPRPGVKGAGPYAPLPPPPTAGGQNACVYQAEPDQATAATSSAWLIGNAAGARQLSEPPTVSRAHKKKARRRVNSAGQSEVVAGERGDATGI